MIKRWRVSNFKSIGPSVNVDFADLTVLVGSNSSGKSSLIHSILAVAQSFRSRAAPGRPLIWNGDLVRLGTAVDVLHNTPEAQLESIELEFELDLGGLASVGPDRQVRLEAVGVLAQLTYEKARAGPGGQLGEMAIARSNLSATSVRSDRSPRGDGSPVHSSIAILRRPGHTKVWRELRDEATRQGLPLQFAEYSVTLAGVEARADIFGVLYGNAWSERYPVVAAEFDRFVPTALVVAARPDRRRLDRLEQLALLRRGGFKGLSASMLESLIGVQLDEWKAESELNDVVEAIRRGRRLEWVVSRIADERKKIAAPPRAERLPLPEPVGSVARDSRSALAESIRYLGPLREDPRAVYPLPATSSVVDVGVKGQFTAAVLHANLIERVTYVDVLKGPQAVVEEPLIEAVRHWLREMRLLADVTTAEAGKLGYTLNVQAFDTSNFVDLTSVGVGVSQVLPILVQALLAPKGSLLIFEQPELHLQPAIQSSLADFLLSVSMAGRRVLVETHSDHFVTRLRRRIAEGRVRSHEAQVRPPVSPNVSDVVRLYFVSRVGGVSEFKPVGITPAGAFEEWPEGFMDHGVRESEALLTAAVDRGSRR